MNEIVERQERAPRPALNSGGSISAIVPQSIEEAYRIANAVVSAGMAPRSLDTPEKAMVAIMHGLEIGMTPMAAMQSIAVVNGFPTIWGDGALGLVRGCGLLEWIKEWAEGEANAYMAFCSVKRKGEPEAITRSFSWEEAKAAGLLAKKGPWENYRSRMFQMRARSYALRDGFADVLRGLRIREEVEDYQQIGPDNARDITPQPSVMQRLRQNATQEPADGREGFSETFVHSETSDALTGEILTDDDAPESVSTPETGNADAPPNAPAEGGDPQTSSPSSDFTVIERSLLIECCAKFMSITTDDALDLSAKRGVLEQAKNAWKAEIDVRLHPKIASFFLAADAIITGKQKNREGSIREFAGWLECEPHEIGGEA